MALYQPMPLPEPMNASPHHSKVKVGLTLADPVFVAGDYVAGKLELECRADKGLGVGVILVELFAIQELHSRDHSATSTFIHSKRVFQGPGLPPSNAVQAHPQPGFPSLPPSYYQARRGLSTFLFRIPIPETSPSSLVFGSGVARVRYELRASVGVVWKGDRRLVIDTQTLDVVSSFPHEVIGVKEPEAITIGENGKLWMQGNLIGPLIVAGESACIQLQVKNHSNKKNTGLSVSLNRTLVLPGIIPTGKHAMELSDTLTHVPFRGTEYIIPPGAEGVAHLVFDVPRQARSVRGGVLDGDEIDPPRSTESLFEIRCSVEVKMSMGLGNKDLVLTIPVLIVHPRSVPPGIFGPPPPAPVASPYTPHPPSHPNAYAYPVPPLSPPIPHFMVDHQYNQIWLPPPTSPMPIHPHMAYPAHPHQYLMSPAPQAALVPPSLYGPQIARPTSAGGNVSIPDPFMLPPSGLPLSAMHNVPAIGLPMPSSPSAAADTSIEMDTEEGKGQRALRVSRHLRMSSRTRSVSPQSHRFPVGAPLDQSTPLQPPTSAENRRLPQPPTASGAIPLDRMENVPLSPPQVYANTMVHSPRPQLTPKHSFYNERPKSERVEVLERMADVVNAQLRDLSGDIPKDEELQPPSKSSPPKVDATSEAEINKTLPAPPVPSGKISIAAPARPALDRIFEDSTSMSTPMLAPSSRAPPTPALVAVLPKRYPRSKIDDFLSPQKNESGLDALEKRLLAEVGTRKFDELNPHKNQNGSKTDVREMMGGTTPIAIPVKTKSDDALNDSAISSLTLANDHKSEDGDRDRDRRNDTNDNDYNGDEDDRADTDMEVEAKTHRGASRSDSGDERGRNEIRDALDDLGDAFLSVKPRHREEADSVPAGSTPTKLSAGSGKSKGDKRSSGRKKERGTKEDRVKAKTEAKGRVAAWLGGVVAEPPQEETIPPSPSSARRPASVLLEGPPKELALKDDKDTSTIKSPPKVVPKVATPLPSPKKESVSDEKGTSAPNPRSSGFLPLHTFKRGTLPRNTVVEESRKVTDIWSAELASRSPPGPIAISPQTAAGIPFRPTPQSVRTDRRVSPPSKRENVLLNNIPPKTEATPVSPSKSGGRDYWVPPPLSRTKTTSPPPVPPPKPEAIKGVKSVAQQPKFPPLPDKKRQDPEVSYDVRSARGGRGGKVTSVAALWASMTNNGAAGGDPPIIRPKPDLPAKSGLSRTAPMVPPSKPPLLGKVALPGLAKPEVPRSRSKSPIVPSIHVPTTQSASSSSRPAPGRSNAVDGDGPSKQPQVPKKLSSAINLAQLSRGPAPPSRSKSTDAHPSTATQVPFSADLKTKASGNVTPSSNNQRPASSAGNKGSDAAVAFKLSAASGAVAGASAAGAARKRTQSSRPIIKSTSVPAMISSSHAVPVLSSTASLARPAPSAPRVATDLVNGRRQIDIGRSGAKAVVDRPVVPPVLAKMGALVSAPEPAVAAPAQAVPITKSLPPDLAFGQARLRDLIKKYQTQAN